MKRKIKCFSILLMTIIIFSGCTQLPVVSPENSYTETGGITPIPTYSYMPTSQTPTVSTSVLPSSTNKPTSTPEPTSTPYYTENAFAPDTDIPDIIEGDGRNSFFGMYEDTENIYDLIFEDYASICSISKINGEVVNLLEHCVYFWFEGDNIYWIESELNICRYDIKTKENINICSTENSSYLICVYSGRLYYIMYRNPGDHSVSDLYSMDINGDNNEKLIENVSRYVIYNNNIFYVPSGNYDKTSIFMYDIDSKNTTELNGKCTQPSIYSIAYGKIYFYDVDEGCIISIDIVTGEKKIFEDADDRRGEIAVVGQYIFYFTNYRYSSTLRAYDIINDKYYDITADFIKDLDASNKNLYAYDDEDNMVLIKITNGKASVEKVKGANR